MNAIPHPLQPELSCNLIMKGGITSGVIYPQLVCRLAETYRLKSIGGSSAGAIAAGVAAAAELRRHSGSDEGFTALRELPDTLTEIVDGNRSRLLTLFQPQQTTKPLFDALIAGLDAKSGAALAGKRLLLERVVTWAKTRSRRIEERRTATTIGMLPTTKASPVRVGFAALQSLMDSYRGSEDAVTRWWSVLPPDALIVLGVVTVWLAWPWGLLGGIPLILLGAVFAILLHLVNTAINVGGEVSHIVLHAVPENGLGLCSGLETSQAQQSEPALTRWLHGYIQQVASQSPAKPVTFGDLEEAGIDLRVMTTNLTQARPMGMPWAEGGFFFEETIWRNLFPSEVVKWLIEPDPSRHDGQLRDPEFEGLCSFAKKQGLYPLPEYRDLPILVAVRMSLSFPILISAVPLKAIDWSLQANQRFRKSLRDHLEAADADTGDVVHSEQVPAPVFDTNWFTDGGLCANLPVHFFDRALSTEPTFAVNLQQHTSVEDDETPEGAQHNSDLPYHNGDGLGRDWTVWERDADGEPCQPTLGKFAGAMAGTLMGWVDNEALRMPGYRDRIVTIFHTKDEGGMNLNMPSATVNGLAARGRNAGDKLARKFTGPFPENAHQTTGLDNHRWIRLRHALTGLSEWLDEFRVDYAAAAPGANPYSALLDGSVTPPSYAHDYRALQGVATMFSAIPPGPHTTAKLASDAPNPRGRLRLVPYDRLP